VILYGRAMKRLIVVVLGALAATLALASAADARYYLNQREAEHYTRVYFHNGVGYHYTLAACRPQGHAQADATYDYHRWVCAFAVGDSRYNASCSGQILILGSHESGYYNYRMLWHQGRCPLGVSTD
jgi:hypothetical protein